MANPFDQFDSAEANPFDKFDEQPEKPGMLSQLGQNVMGLGAAVGDMAGGLVKMPLAIGTSIGGKLMNPDISTEAHRMAGQDTVEAAFPSIGATTGLGANPTYQAAMKPFELIGEGINKAGDFVADKTGSTNVGGAVKLGADIATLGMGIPGAKLAGKGLTKMAERFDPTLKETPKKSVKGADTKAAVEALTEQPAKVEEARALKNQTSLEDSNGQMSLFDQPDMVQAKTPYQAVMGDWRIDENGIPIKADLTMDAMNTENILQKNLWGDELPRKHEQEGKPLSEAIDSMDWAHKRGALKKTQLGREMEASPDLKVGKNLAENTAFPEEPTSGTGSPIPFNFKKQGGGLLISPKKENEAGVLNNIPGIKKVLGAIVPSKLTPDETIEIAKTAKDVDQNFLQKGFNQLTKGGLYQTLKTKNPVVRFTTEKILDADQKSRADIAHYIHDNDTGLGPAMRALSNKEQAEIWSLMDVADKTQKELTPEFLASHGFNEKQIALASRHREVMDYAFDQLNKAREAAGKEPVTKRQAYAAMRATGDYRSLVYKTDEAGEKHVVGVIGSDTKWHDLPAVPKAVPYVGGKKLYEGLPGIASKLKEQGYEIGPVKYYGGVPRERGGAQQAFMDAVQFLSENDPRIKEFLDVLDDVSTQQAYNFLNAKTHTMQKKGVFGMEGRKPWKDAEANALEGLQAQLQYAETAIKWGHMSEAAKEVNQVLGSKDVNMPQAKQWSEDYLQNALGFNPSKTGKALEEAVANGVGWTGVGYSNVRETMAVARKAANTILLGLNPVFWYTNVMQPLAAMPGMMAYLTSKGLKKDFDFGTGYKYLAEGGITAMKEKMGGLDAFEQELVKYAKKQHVYGSDLVEHSNQARKNVSYYIDKIGNAAAAPIESSTRKMMFFAMSHLLKENGMKTKDGLFEAAHNLTDMAMNNYSATERPQAYNAMGPVGDMAVNLSSYKHNELSRTAEFARQIGKDGSAKPLLTQMATGVAFAGITGSLYFAEADWLYKQITKAMGKPDSLTAAVLRMSEKASGAAGVDNKYALSHGGFSFMGLDMSKRLGLSDVIPNSLGEAVFPGGSKLVDIAGAGAKAIGSPTEMNMKRFAREASPNVVTGPMDLGWFSKGDLGSNRETLRGQVKRNTADKVWKGLGATGVHEAVEKTKLFEAENIKQAYADLRKKPLEKARDELYSKGNVSSSTVKEYIKYEGDFNTLVSDLNRMATEQKVPAKDLALLRATMSESVANMKHAQRLMKMYENK